MTQIVASKRDDLQPFIEGATEEAQEVATDYEVKHRQLQNEMRAMITEYKFLSRWLVVEMWWKIGNIILDWKRAAQKELGRKVPLRPFCNFVTQPLGRSAASAYKAVQFRRYFPNEESLDELPFGKAISWRLIVNKVLPGLGKGKSLAKIAQEDQEAQEAQPSPRTIYRGPGRVVWAHDIWIAELPEDTQLKARSPQVVQLIIREDFSA